MTSPGSAPPATASRLPWARLAVASAAVLVIGIGALTAFEGLAGRPVSSLVGADAQGGTTVGRAVGIIPDQNPGPTPAPGPRDPQTTAPSGEPSTSPSPSSGASPTGEPSPTTQPTESPSPSGEPSPTAEATPSEAPSASATP